MPDATNTGRALHARLAGLEAEVASLRAQFDGRWSELFDMIRSHNRA